MGTVHVSGQAQISTVGPVDLGAGAYQGKLNVTSGGGAITQSGAIDFHGDTNFDAGSGGIVLFNPYNLWFGSILFKGSSIEINHPILLGGFANAAMLDQRSVTIDQFVRTTSTSNPARPALATDSTSPQADLTRHVEGVVAVSVEKQASASQTGLISVTVSQDVSSGTKGFVFAVDSSTPGSSPSSEVRASLPGGAALPNWLKFDPVGKVFSAESVPSNAFPLQVVVESGGVHTVIQINKE